MTSDDQRATTAAEILKEVRGLRESAGSLDTRLGRMQRRLGWTITAVVGLVVVLAGFVVLYIRQQGISASQQEIIAAQQRQTCASGNEARAVTVSLWSYVLDLSDKNPAQTPQQKQQVAQFRSYLNTTLAPRDCGGK